MQYTTLGSTGLQVSRIALGCMTYGEPDRGSHPWTLTEEASRPLLRQAVELGVTFFDTANVYSDGSSEEIVGRALQDFTRREEVVVATKVHGRMRPGPNGGGLSRRAILQEIDASLTRLGTDYVDLYQIHRWDPTTPVEETLEALHLQRAHGWTRFVSMQNHLNLLNREEEREMLPLCDDEGIGVIPWSPLARGRLTRDWQASTARSKTDEFGRTLYSAEGNDAEIAAAVAAVAAERGVPRAQVALAWVLRTPVVTAPIIGASKPGHLEDAVAALDLELTDEEVARLEGLYQPHAVAGF